MKIYSIFLFVVLTTLKQCHSGICLKGHMNKDGSGEKKSEKLGKNVPFFFFKAIFFFLNKLKKKGVWNMLFYNDK